MCIRDSSISMVVRTHALGPRLVVSLVCVRVAVGFPCEFEKNEKNDQLPLRTSLFSRGVKVLPSVGPSVASTSVGNGGTIVSSTYGGTELFRHNNDCRPRCGACKVGTSDNVTFNV